MKHWSRLMNRKSLILSTERTVWSEKINVNNIVLEKREDKMMLNKWVPKDWTTLIHQHPYHCQKEQNIRKNPAVRDKELTTVVVQSIKGLKENKAARKQELQSYLEIDTGREEAQRKKNQKKRKQLKRWREKPTGWHQTFEWELWTKITIMAVSTTPR